MHTVMYAEPSRAVSLGMPSLCVHTGTYVQSQCTHKTTCSPAQSPCAQQYQPATQTCTHTELCTHGGHWRTQPVHTSTRVPHPGTHICTVCTNAHVPTSTRPACTHAEPVHTNMCTLTHTCTPTHTYTELCTPTCVQCHTHQHTCAPQSHTHTCRACAHPQAQSCAQTHSNLQNLCNSTHMYRAVHTDMCSHTKQDTHAHRAVHTTHMYTPAHPCAQCCAKQNVCTQI